MGTEIFKIEGEMAEKMKIKVGNPFIAILSPLGLFLHFGIDTYLLSQHSQLETKTGYGTVLSIICVFSID